MAIIEAFMVSPLADPPILASRAHHVNLPVRNAKREATMRVGLLRAMFLIFVALCGAPLHCAFAADNYFAGKTITILVGVGAGGTIDTLARQFSLVLRKHLAGEPSILVQNMPGGAAIVATNYLAERAKPDGLTLLFGPWDPLLQAMNSPTLRARYDKFEYMGGIGDIRVLYSRTDIVPGGLKSPADIAQAKDIALGALNASDYSGLLPHLALNVLGVTHRYVLGYPGGNEVFLAMQRGEVQFHSTAISTFRGRNGAFFKSGAGMGIAYLTPVNRDGFFERVTGIDDMPAFPDLYRDIVGKMPAGANWDALNWLTREAGELTYAMFAPPGTPKAAVEEMRKAFSDSANDPDFVRQTRETNGVPYTYVDAAKGAAIFGELADAPPAVIETLRADIERYR
jgi:tripartite-type tricarboxylate transporter receptor subunit TctC